MKYLLINQQTAQSTLCDKVTIDGFDYYVSDEETKWAIDETNKLVNLWFYPEKLKGFVLATNNPNINIPKVVDEAKVIKIAFKHVACTKDSQFDRGVFHGFVGGYNKSQETHPFSYEDADAYADAVMGGCLLRAKEWKSQQPKKVYYTQTTDK